MLPLLVLLLLPLPCQPFPLQTSQFGRIVRSPAFCFQTTGSFRLIASPFIRALYPVKFLVGRVIVPTSAVVVPASVIIRSALAVVVSSTVIIRSAPAVVVPASVIIRSAPAVIISASVIIGSIPAIVIRIITATVHAAVGTYGKQGK